MRKVRYKYIVESILEVVGEYANSFLLIKPHPKQNIQELIHLLEPSKNVRWIVSGLHLIQLAQISDVVISGYSSGILDSLSVGKSVIEFWRLSTNDSLCRAKCHDSNTTIYRELELAQPANTNGELKQIIKFFFNNSKDDMWQKQQQAFKSICKFSDNASEKIADFLYDSTKRI